VYGVLDGLKLLNKNLAKKELEYYDLEHVGKELYEKYNNLANKLYLGATDHRRHLTEIRNGNHRS
jgi:hypothetical protein